MQDQPALAKYEKYRIGVGILRLKNFKIRIFPRTLKQSCTIKASSATIRRHLDRKGLKYPKKSKTLLLTLIQKEKKTEEL